jgi:hypothetical protein
VKEIRQNVKQMILERNFFGMSCICFSEWEVKKVSFTADEQRNGFLLKGSFLKGILIKKTGH